MAIWWLRCENTAEAGPSEYDDEHQREHPDGQGREVDLPEMDAQVQRAENPVRSGRLVSGEVAELAEDDVQADAGDEAHHHCPGDEAQEDPCAEGAGKHHEDPGEHRQRVERAGRVVV